MVNCRVIRESFANTLPSIPCITALRIDCITDKGVPDDDYDDLIDAICASPK
eukprot:CAMPEP_0119556896 /NCGR_PEP_ID=MMETSP1352-20130426/8715_1 /TAXON_ID=265584 /ORGANISM="Stauroneis constricta, Strain CCMP1120" /LENGTH=51 /DNA_ID=CAMNT_0007603909 /DNA_START=26 /DNA_END=178 /DNA_ORIENTATION=+